MSFVYGVRQQKISLYLHVNIQLSLYKLLKRIVYLPWNYLCTFVKNKLTINISFFPWALKSIPLIYMSIIMPVPHCHDYCTITVSFELEKCESFKLCSSFSNLFWQECVFTLGSYIVKWSLNGRLRYLWFLSMLTLFLILCFPTKQIYPNAIHSVKNVLCLPQGSQQFWAHLFYSYLLISTFESAQHFTLDLSPFLISPRWTFELEIYLLSTYFQIELVNTLSVLYAYSCWDRIMPHLATRLWYHRGPLNRVLSSLLVFFPVALCLCPPQVLTGWLTLPNQWETILFLRQPTLWVSQQRCDISCLFLE